MKPMHHSVTDFPRTARRERLARVLDEFAGVAIRTAEPGTVNVPHDAAVLDALGVSPAEYTAAALDLADELDTTALVASSILDAVAIAFTTLEATE